MTSFSAGHIILKPTQSVESGRTQRESNPGPAHQESRALPTELPHPPLFYIKTKKLKLTFKISQTFVLQNAVNVKAIHSSLKQTAGLPVKTIIIANVVGLQVKKKEDKILSVVKKSFCRS